MKPIRSITFKKNGEKYVFAGEEIFDKDGEKILGEIFGDYDTNSIAEEVENAAVFGKDNKANRSNQTLFGHNSDTSKENLLFAIGNGTENTPSNAFSIDEEGNAIFAGTITAKNTGEGLDNLIDVDNLQLKSVTYQATPDTLVDIITSAQSNSTIQLTAGDYSLLTLIGKKSYPENLTIVGVEGSTMAGVSISSGMDMYDNVYKNGDISEFTMPRGLTFEDVHFTKGFSARNCNISDLTFYKCTFGEGANLQIIPNLSHDQYGNDGSGFFGTLPNYAACKAHNVVVSRCTFVDAIGTESSQANTAIYMSGLDGASISKNIIQKADFNGIQITGNTSADKYNLNTGRIVITDNEIRNTGSRSIRLNAFDHAYVCVEYNELYTADQRDEEANEERIKMTNFTSTTKTRWNSNTYGGKAISVGNGITSDVTLTSVESTQQSQQIAIEELEDKAANFVDYDNWWDLFEEGIIEYDIKGSGRRSGNWIIRSTAISTEMMCEVEESITVDDGQMWIPLPCGVDSETAIAQITIAGNNHVSLAGYGWDNSDDPEYLVLELAYDDDFLGTLRVKASVRIDDIAVEN